MLFDYKAFDQKGTKWEGVIDASNIDSAINSLQRRGYTVAAIDPAVEKSSLFGIQLTFLEHVSHKEIVIFSRQIATLFEAQVSALRIFRLLASETENPLLRRILTEIGDDIQGGSTIAKALARHPDTFSSFYVNMVRAGEESGRLDSIFTQLADYLDRSYEVMSKTRNALIYPAFVIATFVTVMTLMMTLVVPRLSDIILQSGQEVPVFTSIVMAASAFLTKYIVLILIFVAFAGVGVWRFTKTEIGARALDELKLGIPYVGTLYQRLYLSRIADGLSTLLSAGLSMVQTLEITSELVEHRVYREIIEETIVGVKAGRAVSDVLGNFPEIPGVMSQMMKVGEETGSLSAILTTVAKFYQREVNNAVDTLINMIEPAMIVMLGLGVGTLLAAIMMPIYNIATGI
jgi:type IV pilus assembly protein PilC